VRRFAVGFSFALLAWNNLVHLLPGASAAYVPLNLVATAGVLAAARRRGLSAADLGLERRRLRPGIRLGGAVAAVVAGALAVAVAVPALRPLLDDARVRDLAGGAVVYQALVRIPIGTVLLEEVAFRGVLFGALARDHGPLRAALGSSAVFGLWHIRPTLGLLDANDVVGGSAARAGVVALAVLGTGLGGLFFCALRTRSGSTVAPIVAHTATNSLGLIASAVTD
jgi:membrane protease YdiL (CAAX protease family)